MTMYIYYVYIMLILLSVVNYASSPTSFQRDGALKQLLIMLGGLTLLYQLAKLIPNESPVVSTLFIAAALFLLKFV